MDRRRTASLYRRAVYGLTGAHENWAHAPSAVAHAVARPRSRPLEVPEGSGARRRVRPGVPRRQRVRDRCRLEERCTADPGSSRRTRSTRATGTTALDVSGNGHRGRSRARPGHERALRRALSFDGTTSRVALGSARNLLPERLHARGVGQEGDGHQERRRRRRHVDRQRDRPMIWVDHVAGRYRLTIGGRASRATSTRRDPGRSATWQHLAATFDGTTARFYIDGTEVADRTVQRERRVSRHLAHRRLRQRADGFFDGARSTRSASTTAR